MEATAACKYSYFGLPKLSTAKHVQRRDSLSSSRTRDSGYNSDPDTLSPLDPIGLDQEFLLAPIPGVPSFFTNSKVTPFKLHGDSYRSRGFGRHNITSDPVGAVAHRAIPHPPELETVPRHAPVKTLAVQQTSQDDDIERWVNDNLPLRSQPEQRSLSIISLSTASSCDMYTSTDISDDEHDHEGGSCATQQPRSTLKVIELILRRVEISLRHAAYKQCAGNKASGTQTGPYISLDQSSRTTSLSSGSKRKLRQEGTPPPDDDDEGSPNKRRRGSLATTDESETGVRFACPFYKHDPNRYRNRRTCAGPGWPTVHRMKEHLYRSHAQPIFCPICYATFKSDKDQSSHVRLQQCERSSPQQIEGIDRETVWTLRKRTTALRLEEDKWRDVYQTLFPDVPVEDIPSPFYDCDSPSEASRRFRRDLLRRVQEELYSEAAQMPSPVEQQLLRRVAEIVRRCEHDLLNQAHPASTPSFTTDRRASATSSTGSSYQATPAPVLSPEPVQRPSTSALAYQDHRMQGPVSLLDTVQYLPEPTVEFSHVAWDDPSYNAFSLGIDWDDIFPPAPSTQYRSSDEPVAAMSRPMWT